jgi:hypothetical protein
MPKSNAQRQAEFRARRRELPVDTWQFRALMLEAYYLGKADGRAVSNAQSLDRIIETAWLRYDAACLDDVRQAHAAFAGP